MPFSFSFTLTIPGLSNPFSAAGQSSSAPPESESSLYVDDSKQRPAVPPHRRAPSPSLLPPLSRKRGWVPSNSELSHATAVPTLTNGYLDTPGKYRDMITASNAEEDIEEMVADLPPPKRRRTLAGSIVSTALSAALIGTAVGLTVYRLWRDRGKQPESLPPPPYEQGEWVPAKSDSSPAPVTQVTPPTPRSRRIRHVAGRRSQPRHRKVHARAVHASSSPFGPSPVARAPIPPEFNFGVSDSVEGDGDADDQVSWMGDRLAKLIAEGQRALGKEVVVMSEDQEDEVDDDSENWIENDEGRSSNGRQNRNAGLPPYSSRRGSPLPGISPRRSAFDLSYSHGGTTSAISVPGSPRHFGREASVESDTFASRSFREDESTWQTPELRESMERARELYYRSRA